MMMVRLVAYITAVLLGSGAGLAQAGDVQVAVASNFAVPMQAIAREFERDTGHRALLSFGSSGKFYAQIRQGAPFEVFLSADQSKPAALIDASMALAQSRFTYAFGALALWSAEPSPLNNGETLCSGDYRKLAIANPRLAPYGVAAVEVLQALGCYEKVRPKLVHGENIGQTYQFVATGNAELGLVALAQIAQNERRRQGSLWIVPSQLHAPIHQDAVLLKKGADNPAARALLDYLRSESSRKIIADYGYRIPSD